MFSSVACSFRNGQLKQIDDGEGWEKQKHFIQAKTLEKIYANQNAGNYAGNYASENLVFNFFVNGSMCRD